MSVRIEKLHAPAPTLIPFAIASALMTMTAVLMSWWRRPAALTMSEDWLSDHARFEARGGWQ